MKRLVIVLLLMLMLVGCKQKTGEYIEDFYCKDNTVYWDSYVLQDCGDVAGNANTALHCRQDVYFRGEGTYGAACIECFTMADCPYGWDCGDYSSAQPYMCLQRSCSKTSDCPYSHVCENSKCYRQECTDTDKGTDEFVKGTVTTTTSIYSSSSDDSCISATQLEELSCTSDGKSTSSLITCENGCEEGACAEEKCTDSCSADQAGCDGSRRWQCMVNADGCHYKKYTSCSADKVCENGGCIRKGCSSIEDCPSPECKGKTSECLAGTCYLRGECEQCSKDSDCDDSDENTIDECINSKCINTKKEAVCGSLCISLIITILTVLAGLGGLLVFLGRRRK
jgi:hypothetical protein